jgi:hypothetical protein
MRVRHWVKFVAVFSVLLHAGLSVRHNSSVLMAALQESLTLQSGAICGVNVADISQSETPDVPAPAKNISKCPICMGAAPAAALLSDAAPISEAPLVSALKLAIISDTLAPRIAVVLPPSRAPPFTV